MGGLSQTRKLQVGAARRQDRGEAWATTEPSAAAIGFSPHRLHPDMGSVLLVPCHGL